MAFVLDTRLWGGLPLPAGRGVVLALRLVYFDAGGGALTLSYDAAGGCATAATVQVAAAAVALAPWAKVPAAQAPTAPGAWAEISVNITDGYFGRRCGPRGADILLSATADTIVHGFEIYCTSGGGAPTASAPPTPTPTPAPAPASVPPSVPPTPTPSASPRAAGSLGAEGGTATSPIAGPGLEAIVAPLAAAAFAALVAGALVFLRGRRAARRAAALLGALPPGVVLGGPPPGARRQFRVRGLPPLANMAPTRNRGNL